MIFAFNSTDCYPVFLCSMIYSNLINERILHIFSSYEMFVLVTYLQYGHIFHKIRSDISKNKCE